MNRRITRPPGGETSDIFNSPNSTPPSTPRKVKNYQASNIFTPSGANEQRNIRHRPDDDSFKRLFGANGKGDVTDSPRMKNNQKSSIVFADNGVSNGHSNGHATNGHNGHNGGTSDGGSGSSTPSNGTVSPANGLVNGGSNGVSNGSPKTNGTNGVHTEILHKRIPPGGFSHQLW